MTFTTVSKVGLSESFLRPTTPEKLASVVYLFPRVGETYIPFNSRLPDRYKLIEALGHITTGETCVFNIENTQFTVHLDEEGGFTLYRDPILQVYSAAGVWSEEALMGAA